MHTRHRRCPSFQRTFIHSGGAEFDVGITYRHRDGCMFDIRRDGDHDLRDLRDLRCRGRPRPLRADLCNNLRPHHRFVRVHLHRHRPRPQPSCPGHHRLRRESNHRCQASLRRITQRTPINRSATAQCRDNPDTRTHRPRAVQNEWRTNGRASSTSQALTGNRKSRSVPRIVSTVTFDGTESHDRG